MSIRSLRRRLDGLRRAARTETVGKIVVIYPDQWPEAVRDAYEAACATADEGLQADIIERQTGQRPVYPVPGLLPIRGVLPPAVIQVRYVGAAPQ